MIRHSLISILFFFCIQHLHAQDLTGTWEGYMSGEKLRVYIKMEKKELCGYTMDYILRQPSSYCKANFRGWYDSDQEVWVLVGTSFIENSGDHILMLLRLWHDSNDPDDVLRGTEQPKYGSSSMFSSNERTPFRVRRISKKLPASMPDCFPKPDKVKTTAPRREATIKPAIKKPEPVVTTPAKPVEKKPVVVTAKPKPKPVTPAKPIPTVKEPVKVISADTLAKVPKPVIVTAAPKDQSVSFQKMIARKKTEFSRIVVQDRNITLNVYDNGVVDNDTVSIFYNKKLIAGKKMLSEKPLTIKLELDEDAPLHEIVMFAENLGSIPPNTALIVVTVDGKRYELHSSASFTENAVLTFEYKPK